MRTYTNNEIKNTYTRTTPAKAYAMVAELSAEDEDFIYRVNVKGEIAIIEVCDPDGYFHGYY